VKDLPIVDWHNHLDLRMLAQDAPLGSLYEVWVKADPYKHRAMRICGEAERVITGDAPEAEKWAVWMRTLPKLVGNPLFVWSKMEIEWLFGDSVSRKDWWRDIGNVSLAEWTPSKMLSRFNVECMCPCVGVRDELPETPPFVRPSLRMNAGDEISAADLARFNAAGCKVVDISVDSGSDLGTHGESLFRVASYAAEHGWTMLLHLGALRSTSGRLRVAAGPAGGYAAMRAPVDPSAVARFLDGLESASALPRTILLSLNPEAHAQLAVLSGSFVGEGMPGKVQLGPAWWWCDHAEGILDVLEKNAAYGVLSTFIGMTTDSRSLLSFVRHDYFRRLLCGWISGKIASGSFPDDDGLLRPILENVCYGNARSILN
jgi:glucuronate isomerase